MKKKIASLCIAVALALPALSGCAGGTSGGVTWWTTDAATKYMQNREYENEPGKTLSIEMAKDEYEGAQLIVRAEKDVSSYSVEVSDLYSDKGKIDKDDISVYVEKYAKINKKSNTLPDFAYEDYIPDALIPIEKIAEYGEDRIEAGNNQGFYIEVQTDEGTPAGDYRGYLTLTADGSTEQVPVSVTVWDFTVEPQTNVMNYWGNFNWSEWGSSQELDSGEEMAASYFEFMLRYRMNSELPFSGIGGPERYVELLRKYYHADGFSSYRFHYEYNVCLYRGMRSYFDCAVLKEYLTAVVKASLEDRTNYLDKAYFYFLSIIDEPSSAEAFAKCEEISRVYDAVLRDLNTELKTMLCGSEDYGYYIETVEETLLSMPNLLTYSDIAYYQAAQNADIEHFDDCLMVQIYDDEKVRREHEGETFWFYTCTEPHNPYPTTQLDDYAVNTRLLGWLLKAYGVQGYLNWMASLHSNPNGYVYYDPYTHATIGDGGWSNGDGFVIYPGKSYGIEGPLPSLRAVAFRDAMEDYSYLDTFEAEYDGRGLDGEQALQIFFDRLFDGSKVKIQGSQPFNAVRRELAQAIESAGSDDILYESVTVADDEVAVVFAVNPHVKEVLYKGAALTAAGGKFTVSVDLRETSVLVLDLVTEEGTKTVERALCGEYILLDACESAADTLLKCNTYSAIEINADAAYTMSGNSLKVTLQGKNEPISSYTPNIYIEVKNINGGELADVDLLTLNIYSTYGEEMYFSVTGFDGKSETLIAGFYLQQGWNRVVVSGISNYAGKNFERISFKTENFYEPGGRVIYVDEISCLKTIDEVE